MLPAFGLIHRMQVGDTGPAESTRQGNLQRVWSSFSGLAGQMFTNEYSRIFYGSFGGTQKNSGRYMKFAAQTITVLAANIIPFCVTRGKFSFSSYKMGHPAPGPQPKSYV